MSYRSVYGTLAYFALAVRSPLNRWLGEHDTASLAFVTLNYSGVILAMAATAQYHGPSRWALSTGAFVQWLLVGFLAMWIVQWLRCRQKR
jgi:hypothetical protein